MSSVSNSAPAAASAVAIPPHVLPKSPAADYKVHIETFYNQTKFVDLEIKEVSFRLAMIIDELSELICRTIPTNEVAQGILANLKHTQDGILAEAERKEPPQAQTPLVSPPTQEKPTMDLEQAREGFIQAQERHRQAQERHRQAQERHRQAQERHRQAQQERLDAIQNTTEKVQIIRDTLVKVGGMFFNARS